MKSRELSRRLNLIEVRDSVEMLRAAMHCRTVNGKPLSCYVACSLRSLIVHENLLEFKIKRTPYR